MRRDLLSSPRLERQGICGELKVAMALDVFVSNDRLDCRVGVMDQQLINRLERDLILIRVVV